MHGGLRALAETEAIKAAPLVDAKETAAPSNWPVIAVQGPPSKPEVSVPDDKDTEHNKQRRLSMGNIFAVC